MSDKNKAIALILIEKIERMIEYEAEIDALAETTALLKHFFVSVEKLAKGSKDE